MISPVDNESSRPTQCEGGSLCPLNRARVGSSVRIKQLPVTNEIVTRLREIGLGEEQTVRLISTRSNVICQVCNSRLAISNELAESILVEPAAAR